MVERLNTFLMPGEKKFYTPDIRFNRSIGRWAGQKFHCETGEMLDDRSYLQHCEENLPGAKDKELLLDIIRNEKRRWIGEKAGARDPLSTYYRAAKVGHQFIKARYKARGSQ